MPWGLDAPDTPGAPDRCGCCGSTAHIRTAATSHRTGDRYRLCGRCDCSPAVPQAPWDGFLWRAVRDLGDGAGSS